MTALSFNVGDRVSFEFYGEQRAGTVSRKGSCIVFVLDDNGRERWMHPESLTNITRAWQP